MNIAADAMIYVREIAPLLLIIGGVSFADLTISFLIRHVKSIEKGKFLR